MIDIRVTVEAKKVSMRDNPFGAFIMNFRNEFLGAWSIRCKVDGITRAESYHFHSSPHPHDNAAVPATTRSIDGLNQAATWSSDSQHCQSMPITKERSISCFVEELCQGDVIVLSFLRAITRKWELRLRPGYEPA